MTRVYMQPSHSRRALIIPACSAFLISVTLTEGKLLL